MKDFKRNKQSFGGSGKFGGSRDRPEREFTRDRPRRDFSSGPRREFSRDRLGFFPSEGFSTELKKKLRHMRTVKRLI